MEIKQSEDVFKPVTMVVKTEEEWASLVSIMAVVTTDWDADQQAVASRILNFNDRNYEAPNGHR